MAELILGRLGVVDLVDLGCDRSAEGVGRDALENRKVCIAVEQADVPQPALDVGGVVPGAVAGDEDRVEGAGRLGDLAPTEQGCSPVGKRDRSDRSVSLAVVDPVALSLDPPIGRLC